MEGIPPKASCKYALLQDGGGGFAFPFFTASRSRGVSLKGWCAARGPVSDALPGFFFAVLVIWNGRGGEGRDEGKGGIGVHRTGFRCRWPTGKERAWASDGLLYASGQRLDEAEREEAAPPPFLMGPMALCFFYVAFSFGKSQMKWSSDRDLPNGEKLLILRLEGQRSVTHTPASK